VIAGTMREILGTEWSPEIDGAWLNMLEEIDGVVLAAPPADVGTAIA
jgi:hypothetical protein